MTKTHYSLLFSQFFSLLSLPPSTHVILHAYSLQLSFPPKHSLYTLYKPCITHTQGTNKTPTKHTQKASMQTISPAITLPLLKLIPQTKKTRKKSSPKTISSLPTLILTSLPLSTLCHYHRIHLPKISP